MGRVENDLTKASRPAVIITGPRTGGTLLTHALSNHPFIGCVRGEPLHALSTWRMNLYGVEPVKILQICTSLEGYLISMCKVAYEQAWYRGVWEYLIKAKIPILHLTRQDVLAQTVSFLLNKLARDGTITHPQHSFQAVAPVKVELSPDAVVRHYAWIVRKRNQVWDKIKHSGCPVLQLTYEQITGGIEETQTLNADATRQICKFLGVSMASLPISLKRVNRRLEDEITNWGAVKGAVEKWQRK